MQIDAEMLDRKNLTPTEGRVLVELCCAKQSKGISRALGISIKAVERHIDHVYEKLGIRWLSINKRSAAILIALQSGMVKTTVKSIVLVLIVQSALLLDVNMVRPSVRLTKSGRGREFE